MLRIQWIFAYILLPAINLQACFLADPLRENITHIAYANHHFLFVFLWALSCASYLWFYTNLFMIAIQYKKSAGHFALALSCISMLISVCIPYTADETQLISKLHVNLAMFATVLYMILFLHTLYHCFYYDYPLCMRILPSTLALFGILSLLFLLTGSVSTLLEISFVIGMGLLHLHIQRCMQKNKNESCSCSS